MTLSAVMELNALDDYAVLEMLEHLEASVLFRVALANRRLRRLFGLRVERREAMALYGELMFASRRGMVGLSSRFRLVGLRRSGSSLWHVAVQCNGPMWGCAFWAWMQRGTASLPKEPELAWLHARQRFLHGTIVPNTPSCHSFRFIGSPAHIKAAVSYIARIISWRECRVKVELTVEAENAVQQRKLLEDIFSSHFVITKDTYPFQEGTRLRLIPWSTVAPSSRLDSIDVVFANNVHRRQL